MNGKWSKFTAGIPKAKMNYWNEAMLNENNLLSAGMRAERGRHPFILMHSLFLLY